MCLAKLDNVAFDDLLKESSLIVVARSTESVLNEVGGGHSVLKVVRVVRGQYPGSTISIAWPGREDDQGILNVGREYVLFLRKDGDTYVDAIHGRSYWLITYARDLSEVIEYSYPTAYVTLPNELISRVELLPMGRAEYRQPCHVEAIVLERLLKSIRAKGDGTG